MVRVELEDVVVCVGGCVDIDCEEVFKVLRGKNTFFFFFENQKFFLKQSLCVCACVVLLFRFGCARESAIEKNNSAASISSSTCYNGC